MLTTTLLCCIALLTGARAGSISPNRNVSTSLFFELEELSRLVGIAYCVGNQGMRQPFECLNRCDDFKNYTLVETWNIGLLDPSSCGYVALSHPPNSKRILVVFRGSNSLSDAMYDLMTQPAQYLPYPLSDPDGRGCHECKVHSGFMRLWNSTRGILIPVLEKLTKDYPEYQLVLAGHSLGGAVAGLAALEFAIRGWKPSVTTFGEPRFGNQRMADFVDQIFLGSGFKNSMAYRRVTHVGDPVPLLPLDEWGWAMHGGEIFISKAALPPSIEDLKHCVGDRDPNCIAGSEASLNNQEGALRHDKSWLSRKQHGGLGVIPGFPAEWKLWEILFSHREYFWRLGLCWDPQSREYPDTPFGDNESSEL